MTLECYLMKNKLKKSYGPYEIFFIVGVSRFLSVCLCLCLSLTRTASYCLFLSCSLSLCQTFSVFFCFTCLHLISIGKFSDFETKDFHCWIRHKQTNKIPQIIPEFLLKTRITRICIHSLEQLIFILLVFHVYNNQNLINLSFDIKLKILINQLTKDSQFIIYFLFGAPVCLAWLVWNRLSIISMSHLINSKGCASMGCCCRCFCCWKEWYALLIRLTGRAW